MSTRWLLAAPVVALVLLAGCQRPAETLPPAPKFDGTPAEDARPATVENDSTGAADAGRIVPGSVEDFLRYAGTDTVLFAYDSAELGPEAKAILDRQAEWLKRYPNVKASLEGHADERGTREYNFGLGERRAASMRFYMITQGLAEDRLTTTSFGKERPAVKGSDEESWRLNRRGQTVLIGAVGQN